MTYKAYDRRFCQAFNIMTADDLVVEQVEDDYQSHWYQQPKKHGHKIILHGLWLDLGAVLHNASSMMRLSVICDALAIPASARRSRRKV